MPNPVLLNLWACNPWQRDTARQVSADQDVFDINFKQTAADILAEPIVPDEILQRHQILIADWPDVPIFVSEDLYVGGTDEVAVTAFRNSMTTTDAERAKDLECYDYARYQLDKAGYGTTGNPSDQGSTNFRILLQDRSGGDVENLVQVEETVGAIELLKDQLPRQRPILLGLHLTTYDPLPNDDDSTPLTEPTNHFVVAVGMGTDDEGPFIAYYDYLNPPGPNHRLYLREDLRVTSRHDTVFLVQVRRSWRKPAED